MKILIIKMSSLGDIIHVFPAIAYIKHLYPQAQIDWVVEKPFAELVQSHPDINHVFVTQTKKWRKHVFKKASWQEFYQFRKNLCQNTYDYVFDFQGNVKSGLVTLLSKSRNKIGFAFKSIAEWPNILTTHYRFNPPEGRNIREDYLYLVRAVFKKETDLQEDKEICLKLSTLQQEQLDVFYKNLTVTHSIQVLICPGSNWQNKQVSKETLQNFLLLVAQALPVHYFFVWGNEEEKKLGEQLSTLFPSQANVVDKLSLPALQNLMTRMQLIIAMDSLPLHLAGTTSCLTYSIFGASSANKYCPLGSTQEAFQGSCPYNKQFIKRCPLLRTCETGACIKSLEGQQLFHHFMSWWQHMQSPSSTYLNGINDQPGGNGCCKR